jgi:uncharacterized membrane protein YeaQ/YmgE (transglycosylase-associated protein family)
MDIILWFIKSPFICVGWIVIGFLAGALARRIMGSSDKSFISDILLGILGAIVGGWIVGFITDLPNGGLPLVVANLVVATAGAALLIWLRNTIFGGGKRKAA